PDVGRGNRRGRASDRHALLLPLHPPAGRHRPDGADGARHHPSIARLDGRWVRRRADVTEALERARLRLDGLDLYPRPVRTDSVRVLVSPWLFRLPWFRRFDGYAVHRAILV